MTDPTPRELLERAHSWLFPAEPGAPPRWSRGALMRDRHRASTFTAASAVSACAVGGLVAGSGLVDLVAASALPAFDAARNLLRDSLPAGYTVECWNDRTYRRPEQVSDLYQRAIKLAIQREENLT